MESKELQQVAMDTDGEDNGGMFEVAYDENEVRRSFSKAVKKGDLEKVKSIMNTIC